VAWQAVKAVQQNDGIIMSPSTMHDCWQSATAMALPHPFPYPLDHHHQEWNLSLLDLNKKPITAAF
jgi:hypothetical protein